MFTDIISETSNFTGKFLRMYTMFEVYVVVFTVFHQLLYLQCRLSIAKLQNYFGLAFYC